MFFFFPKNLSSKYTYFEVSSIFPLLKNAHWLRVLCINESELLKPLIELISLNFKIKRTLKKYGVTENND